MNFSNIYREYLTNLVEAQSYKSEEDRVKQVDLDERRQIIAFIQAARDVFNAKNALSRQNQDEIKTLAQKYLKYTSEDYTQFVEQIVLTRPVAVSMICGDNLELSVDEHLFGAILDYLGIYSNKRSECIDKYKAARDEALKRQSALNGKIFTEFKKFYDLSKKDAIESGIGKSMNREQLDVALKNFDKLDKNSNSINNFFGSIDKDLQWMDDTFVKDSSKFIYASELKLENWISMVIQIEQDSIANASINVTPKDAKEQFKEIIEGCVKLEKDFDDIMKDKGLQELAKKNGAVSACLRAAGGILSGMSLTLGAFTYALGAFIPGGAYYAEYLAKLVKWGRRLGKLISNSGSPLDNAESKKHKVHDNNDDDNDEKEDVSVRHNPLKHKHDLKKDEDKSK
jgi:hypothetical protein